MRKAPVLKMNDLTTATWDQAPLVRGCQYQVKDISRSSAAGKVESYRLSAPSLREDIWVDMETARALVKSIPEGLHEHADLSNVKFTSIPVSAMRVGDIVVVNDPYRKTGYGLGGKGVFEIIRKPGAANVSVLSLYQPAPNGPVYRQELKIPRHHIEEVKRVQYQ